MISLSDKNLHDVEEMKLLWKECFGDSDSFIDFYFDKVVARNRIVIMKEDGIITGMIHLNPYTFLKDGKEQIRTCYIVGVCVREGYRNEGRMSRLMNYAFSILAGDGIRFVYLWPKKEEYYTSLGFRTCSTESNLVIHRLDLDFLFDEMITPRCDYAFGKLVGRLIMPHYSAEDINCLVNEISSEGGSLYCLEKRGIPQGYYSILKDGETLLVQHIVPYFGLREYISRLLKDVRLTLLQENMVDVKKICISMDSRIMNCFAKELDMNQVHDGHPFMVCELKESGIDYSNILFSEVV